jgi:hypothetical protein
MNPALSWRLHLICKNENLIFNAKTQRTQRKEKEKRLRGNKGKGEIFCEVINAKYKINN